MQLSERERNLITLALAGRAIQRMQDGNEADAHEALDLAERMSEVEMMRCDFACSFCHEGDSIPDGEQELGDH